MIKIIDFINDRLSSLTFIDEWFGFVEKRPTDKAGELPVYYDADKEVLMPVRFQVPGMGYIRQKGTAEFSIVENPYSLRRQYEVSVPMAAVVKVQAARLGGMDVRHRTELALAVVQALTFDGKEMGSNNPGNLSMIRVQATEHDVLGSKVLNEEFSRPGKKDFSPEDIVISVGFRISFRVYVDCFEDLCKGDGALFRVLQESEHFILLEDG